MITVKSSFLSIPYIPKGIVLTAEKKQVTIALLYIGMIRTELKRKLA